MKHGKGKRHPRFLLEHCNSPGQVIDLTEDLMHYASRVLRIREGEMVRIWNGRLREFSATVHYLSKKQAQARVHEEIPLENTELSRPVHILQALPEGDKMDWVLEKCTELGASGFLPVQAQRSVVKLEGDRALKRQAHWERVVLAASLQSERAALAQIAPCGSLESALDHMRTRHPDAKCLWFTPQAQVTLGQWLGDNADWAKNPTPMLVCVGPEGGWTEEETALACRMGATPLRFSRRVLRTETFAMACTAQLTALLGLEDQ